ncbi:uncharacterized protein LOC124622722 [Schistocerca americana]|uniref:uncharacterized protein LOC124622722 n=1 Tax=Schistocerca americana TaxID=7009 RepID=UPI001F502B26|nr:uncharacterized protein LOC124622722 [Schistocerca americana]
MAASRALAVLASTCLLLLLGHHLVSASARRTARNVPLLVFPNGGTFKFVVGITTPVKLPNRTMVMQLQFQWLYAEMTNISQAEQDLQVTVGRAAAYGAISSIMDGLGVDGHSCLLRAICEAAETPLLHDGLLGELAHLLLSEKLDLLIMQELRETKSLLQQSVWPERAGGKKSPGNQEEELQEHREAREAGRGGGGGRGGACLRRYDACRPGHGLLDAVSKLFTA